MTALALLPLIVVINATSGLYNRDELLLRKSTLDEAPAVFQAATLTTVVAFLLESARARHADGRASLRIHLARSLSLIVIACRVAARAIARHATAPERCLLVGDAAVADAAPSQARREPEREGDAASGGSRWTRARTPTVARVLGTPEELAARRRRARRPPRDRRGRRGRAPARARVDPEREGAGRPGQRAAADVRGGRVVGRLRLPRRPHDPRRPPLRACRRRRAASSARSTSSARRWASCCSRRSCWRSPWWSSSPPGGRSSSARRASGATATPSRCSSTARCTTAPTPGRPSCVAQRGRRPVQDRRRSAHHAGRAVCSADVARRAPAALQRPSRSDEPRRPSPARARRGPAHPGLVPAAPLADARDDRRLAGLRRRSHPAARDGRPSTTSTSRTGRCGPTSRSCCAPIPCVVGAARPVTPPTAARCGARRE